MMGRYGFRTGVVDNPFGGRATPDKEICVAKPLKNAGYATAVVGKWRQLPSCQPRRRRQSGMGRVSALGHRRRRRRGSLLVQGISQQRQGGHDPGGKYGPEYLQDYVVDFIRRHREQPFFVYYPMTMIHGGFKPTPDTAPGVSDRAHLYTDTITYMDKLIGKLMTALDEMNLREKTLVIFTGDNGSVDPQTIHGRVVDGVKHDSTRGAAVCRSSRIGAAQRRRAMCSATWWPSLTST